MLSARRGGSGQTLRRYCCQAALSSGAWLVAAAANSLRRTSAAAAAHGTRSGWRRFGAAIARKTELPVRCLGFMRCSFDANCGDLGLHIDEESGRVLEVRKDSPAQQLGVQEGWYIDAVNGQTVLAATVVALAYCRTHLFECRPAVHSVCLTIGHRCVCATVRWHCHP